MLAIGVSRTYYAVIRDRQSLVPMATETAIFARSSTETCQPECQGDNTFRLIMVSARVSLSEVDRLLLQRCLDQAPRAWQDFVDRFLGLVVHVANHTANSRNRPLDASTRDDMVAEVFLTLVSNDFAVLRRFRRNCSLATYLTVVSRRVITRRLADVDPPVYANDHAQPTQACEARIDNQEEVQRLLLRLDPKEASVVRMYHLEGKTYQEISQVVGMSENSIGPVLSRARDKMRNGRG